MRALDVDISKSHVASTSSADLVFPLEGSSGSHVQNARSIDDDTHRSEGRLPSVQEPLSANAWSMVQSFVAWCNLFELSQIKKLSAPIPASLSRQVKKLVG